MPSMYSTTRDADPALRTEAHTIALVSNSFMKPVILNDTPVTKLIDTGGSHVLMQSLVVRPAKVEVRSVTYALYTAGNVARL